MPKIDIDKLVKDKIIDMFDEISGKYGVEFDDLSWVEESELLSATDELIHVVEMITKNVLNRNEIKGE